MFFLLAGRLVLVVAAVLLLTGGGASRFLRRAKPNGETVMPEADDAEQIVIPGSSKWERGDHKFDEVIGEMGLLK